MHDASRNMILFYPISDVHLVAVSGKLLNGRT
jgi:hypothetical protein